jgi:hypothetical protein
VAHQQQQVPCLERQQQASTAGPLELKSMCRWTLPRRAAARPKRSGSTTLT